MFGIFGSGQYVRHAEINTEIIIFCRSYFGIYRRHAEHIAHYQKCRKGRTKFLSGITLLVLNVRNVSQWVNFHDDFFSPCTQNFAYIGNKICVIFNSISFRSSDHSLNNVNYIDKYLEHLEINPHIKLLNTSENFNINFILMALYILFITYRFHFTEMALNRHAG